MNHIVGFISIAIIVHVKSAELPSNFQVCNRNDPAFLECVSKSAYAAIASMAGGLKSFGILPLDPLQCGDVTIGKKGGAVSVQQSYKNAKLYGLTKNFEINYEQIDFNTLVFRNSFYNEQVDFVADYRMDGQVLLLPIRGNGRSNITMVGLSAKNTMHCTTYTKDGETYLKVMKYTCNFNPKKVIFNFTNLFNGDPALSNQLNKFLNENSEVVFQETKVEYEETFGLIFAKIANDIFSRVPLNKIFPE